MKQIIFNIFFTLVFVIAVYGFNYLTNHDRNVYTGTSLGLDINPVFSYEDAKKVAESFK